MKNSNLKRILSTVLFVALVLMTVFAISACKKEHVHDLDVVTVEPTCTKDGSKTTTCLDPECDFEKVEVLHAKGHDYYTLMGLEPTCTENGFTDYQVCSVCEETKGFTTLEATGHTPGEAMKENVVEPTCTDKGSYDHIVCCVNCNAELDNHKESIPATGHDWVEVPAKAATCKPGHYEYYKCACGETKDYVEIPKAYDCLPSDHPIELERKGATCTNDGFYKEAIVCMNDECGAILSEISVVVLEKLGHDFVHVEAQDATCTVDGWSAYDYCTRCDVKEGYEKKVAPGHIKGDVVVENKVESTCASKGSYDNVVYCTVCEEELSRKAASIAKLPHAEENKKFFEAKDNSCTEIGWDSYWVCGDCGYSTYVEIPVRKHNESEVKIEYFVEPTCAVTGSYDRVIYCTYEDCKAELSRESWIVPVLNHAEFITIAAKAATCTEIGWNQYTCCSKCSYSEDYVELSALGHDIVKLDYVAPNCVDTGLTAGQYCSRCDACTVEQEVILADGHNMVYIAAVAPNCTETGLTSGQYCTKCDACTVDQVVVDALGHKHDANGVCSVCGDRVSLNLSVNANGVITNMGNCKDKHVIIPEYINGVKVVAIAEGAFKGTGIESVVIPSTVKTIEQKAFFSCASLKSVVIGDGVEHIADGAFLGCTSLTSVTISGSVKSIGDRAFFSCGNLKTVYYHGTAAQWNSIQIGLLNDDLKKATVSFI